MLDAATRIAGCWVYVTINSVSFFGIYPLHYKLLSRRCTVVKNFLNICEKTHTKFCIQKGCPGIGYLVTGYIKMRANCNKSGFGSFGHWCGLPFLPQCFHALIFPKCMQRFLLFRPGCQVLQATHTFHTKFSGAWR